MTDSNQSRIVLPRPGDRPAGPAKAPVGAWTLLAVAGWGFLLIGLMDIGFVWYPTAFGNGGWEFGSVTAALNGLPLPVLGLALILAGAVARGADTMARVVQGVSALLVIGIVVMAVVYVRRAPEALAATSDALSAAGLRKAIVRTVAQIVIYGGFLGLVIRRAGTWVRPGDRG